MTGPFVTIGAICSKPRASEGSGNVGIICAQSIGETFTQGTLNTFHQAGMTVSSGLACVQELLNVSKNPKNIFYTVHGKIMGEETFLDILATGPLRATSGNVWDIYRTLGIEAARDYLVRKLVKELPNVLREHLTVLVDKMVFTGDIFAVNRHSIKKENSGVFAKASFEETFEHFLTAALNNETDPTTGLSAGIICGKSGPTTAVEAKGAVRIPYSSKLLFQMLNALCIKTKIGIGV